MRENERSPLSRWLDDMKSAQLVMADG